MKDKTTWGLVKDAAAPLIGRTAELAALDEALAIVERDKTPRVVTLVGPQGVGKTRLIQDFVIKHRATRGSLVPRVYRGSARDAASSAFSLFARLLRSRFGLVEGMREEDVLTQLRGQVANVVGDRKVGDVVYFLGQFLGVTSEESPLTRALKDDPHESAILRRALLKAFFEADAKQAPICLVFEDLHEAHVESINVLRYLIDSISGPVLILCAGRQEFLTRFEDWPRAGEARHKMLEVLPLRESESIALMEALLSPCQGGPPAQLVDAACAFASGTPALLEQMIRIYHDKGVLEEITALSEKPEWKVDLERVASVELPLTIDDAVNARIAALEPFERTLLEQAAAMGSVFWSGAFVVLARMGREAPDVWAEAADDDAAEVAATLAELVERDYILKLPDSSFTGSEEFVFKHNREREAITKRTPASSSKRYHLGIADWLTHQESLRSNEEYLAMLADHRERGGDGKGAGLAYVEAGQLARQRYANAKASEYFEKGLALLGETHTTTRIDALHDYGDVLLLSGRADDALASFREMLTLAYRLDLRRKGGAAHNRIGRLYRDTGSLDDSSKHLTTALALFQGSDDERGVASTIDDIGKLHWMKGEYELALTSLRDGLARRRRLADRRSIALSLNNIGCVLQDSGEFSKALDSFQQSLQIRREIEDLVGVSTTLNNLGTVSQDQQQFETALKLFTEAIDVARQIGDRNRTALVLVNLGETHYRMGSPDKAIEVLKQAEELCDELGDRLGLAETMRGLGKAYLLQKDLTKAREHIGRAVDLFAEVRSKVHLGGALRTLGEITAAGGWGAAHTKSAREYFARAASIFEQTGNEIELARTFKVFARFLLSDPMFISDETSKREAESMNQRAAQIFSRLGQRSSIPGT
jgi:tetratricopeptide (TPR) repeat protein